MAVLTNTMMQGTAAISGEAEPYNIEKSILFNHHNKPNLQNDIPTGNTRIWTFSTWLKRSLLTAQTGNFQTIFEACSGGSNMSWLSLSNADDAVQFQTITSGSVTCSATTNHKLRDPSAWCNIVIAFDSNQAVQSERYKAYINGKFAPTNQDNAIEQYMETRVNNAKFTIGGAPIGQGPSYYLDGYLAETYLIDGLQLSPGAFGSFDSLGVWNPKAFARPAPNDGTTWSNLDYWSCGEQGYAPLDNAFDGNTGTIGELDNSGTTGYHTQTFTPPTPIKFSSGVRIHGTNANTEYSVNGGKKVTGIGGGVWQTIYEGGGEEIKTIEFTADTAAPAFRAIEVDGVTLVDGQTDTTTRDNLNDGTTWSNGVTLSSGSFDGGFEKTKAFDGSLGTYARNGTASATMTFTPSSGIAYTSGIRIYTDRAHTACTLNGSSVTAPSAAGWHRIASGSGTLTSISLQKNSDSSTLGAVEVDGQILIDSSFDNSLHLKYSDTTSDSSLGRDYFSDTDATNVGALPIYNTNNEFTLAKGTGYRGDTYKANLVFAMPGDVLTDEHDEIKGSGSAKTVTNDGVAVSTDKSKFYGSSLRIEGTDMLSCASSADFNLNGGDWCVEGWFYSINDTSAQQVLIENGTAGVTGWSITRGTNRRIYVYMASTESMGGDDTTLTPDNEWYHLALVRSGSKTTLYINGIPKRTETHDAADGVDGLWIGERSNSSLGFNGYMQDIRIYKGNKKYSRGFIPVRYKDLTNTDLSITGESAGFAGINHCVVDNYSNQSYNNTNGNPSEAWIGTVAEVAAGGFWSTDRIYWVDLGQTRTIEKFVWKLTSDGNSGASTTNFIMWYTDDPASTGSTRCGGGCTVTGANTFSGSMTGNMVVTMDWGSGNAITNRYIGLSSGSGAAGTHFKLTDYEFTDANDGPAAKQICTTFDTPTNYEPASGSVRGNYATLNPLIKASGITLSRGNLSVSSNSNHNCVAATMGIRTGKWYWEMTRGSGTSHPGFGVKLAEIGSSTITTNFNGNPGFSIRGNEARYWDGTEYNGGLMAGVLQDEGETLGFAFDCDAGKIWARKADGTWANSGNPAAGSGSVGTDFHNDVGNSYWLPVLKAYDGSGHTINFGATPFKYTAPTGFLPLCTQNLPDTFAGEEDVVNNPSKFFDVVKWQGNGTDNSDIKGLNFQPDLVWIKERGSTGDHHLFDAVRGATKALRTNVTDAEVTDANELKAFNSDGFRLGTGGDVNNSVTATVGWTWDAGTAANGSTNTDGDNITVAVGKQWVNATAGFSITEYAGDGSGAANNDSGDAVGHGLNAKPDFIIIKKKDGVNGWPTYHNYLTAAKHLNIQTHNATESSNYCYASIPTNTKVDLGNNPEVNGTGNNYIMYCWTSIPGYSHFSVYSGNNNDDGPFVYCGFRPRWIMTKCEDAATTYWMINDTERSPINMITSSTGGRLNAAGSNAESDFTSGYDIDILSNGFKVRDSGLDMNGNNNVYIFAAFAENPFKTARAR